ncbi:MAG: hypothetical protein U0790_00930 [Isosphaeraceae bacterium]
MSHGTDLIARIANSQNLVEYQKKHWTGSFAEYLDIIRREPQVTRTSYQRVYDMILAYGTEEITVNKEKMTRYKFFDDTDNDGQDAVFGIEKTLMNLVNVLKSAAFRYGTERRVLLLHGPGGQLKSTIARLLKKGLSGTAGPTRAPVHLQLARRGRRGRRRPDLHRLPDARGTAPPDPRRIPRGPGGRAPLGPPRL